MNKKQEIMFLVFLIILFFTINYSFLNGLVVNYLTDSELVFVERIIDGDTVVAGNQTIRLLGMNSPERGEKYYSEAKEFLEEEILNKKVQLKFGKDREDRYGRTLAYIFLNNKNVNLKLVESGLANYYFPSGKDQYYDDFESSWLECIENNKNLCEKSEGICSSCIKLKSLNAKTQEVVLYNNCDFSCKLTDWEIKDEGRKKFNFPEFVLDSKKEIKIKVNEERINEENILTWERKTYVWTRTGDTLFLRDENKELILWENY